MKTKDIPVLLITGYLGSGKTTLLNHILNNQEGIKFAVIVNDIGAVNIDADLIQHGGIVNKSDDSLVSLQNGCICCTLKKDLIDQLQQLLKMKRFDYIVIEASGVCDPAPIAQTICSFPKLGKEYTKYGLLKLDSITTVVDALRMRDEFHCAECLDHAKVGEEDIENLLIQQIEFCNLVLLNKASEVSPEELSRMKHIIHALQPKTEIVECDYAQVDLKQLVNSKGFEFEQVANSAGWLQEINKHIDEDECESHASEEEHHHHHHEGCSCHHHHHHHNEEGETEEYGIGTYVYYRRHPFDLDKFNDFIENHWPHNIIRAKGLCYFSQEFDMSYLFEQAGSQKQRVPYGHWFATMPKNDLQRLLKQEPGLAKEWDETYGDRMQKIVFIGQNLDKEFITQALDACLKKD